MCMEHTVPRLTFCIFTSLLRGLVVLFNIAYYKPKACWSSRHRGLCEELTLTVRTQHD